MKPTAIQLLLLLPLAALTPATRAAASHQVLRCVASATGAVRYATVPVAGFVCSPLTGEQPTTGAPTSAPAPKRGQIFAFDLAGVRQFATALPPGATNVRTIRYTFIETCFACSATETTFKRSHINRVTFASEFQAAARNSGVEEALLRAIAHAESAYVPDAISRAGAQGVMQLMPATARRFGVANALDAAQNIQGGAAYLAFLLRRYPGDLLRVAAAYNAGEGTVDRYGGVPPYAETQQYVRRVEQLLTAYRAGQ